MPEPAPAAAGARASNSYSVSSCWNPNGSVMALSAQGDRRVFYYEQPRELVANAGAGRGTLLFKGKVSGHTYSGQAYLVSRRCASLAYPVKGTVSEDLTRIELTGKRPVRDTSCRRTGTKIDRLVFDYRSKSL